MYKQSYVYIVINVHYTCYSTKQLLYQIQQSYIYSQCTLMFIDFQLHKLLYTNS